MNQRREVDCAEALRLLADYLDSELGDERDSAVRRHLKTCRSCYSRAEFERSLRRMLRDRLGTRDVPTAYESRIRELLRRLPEAS